MTEAPEPAGPKPVATARASRRKPRLAATVLAALAGFFVVFELLAYQLRTGNDPALSAAATSGATAQVRQAASIGATPKSSLVTRTSGAAPQAPIAQNGSVAAGRSTLASASPTAKRVTTRASGAAGGPGGRLGHERETERGESS